MTVIVAAVSLKTESGDSYLFCERADEINDIIRENLMEEMEYVSDWSVETYPPCSKTNQEINNRLSNDTEGE